MILKKFTSIIHSTFMDFWWELNWMLLLYKRKIHSFVCSHNSVLLKLNSQLGLYADWKTNFNSTSRYENQKETSVTLWLRRIRGEGCAGRRGQVRAGSCFQDGQDQARKLPYLPFFNSNEVWIYARSLKSKRPMHSRRLKCRNCRIGLYVCVGKKGRNKKLISLRPHFSFK